MTATTCTCCGQVDGVADGVAVDDYSGLCLYCQPCPWCGRQGTGCQPEHGSRACDPTPSPDGTPLTPYVDGTPQR